MAKIRALSDAGEWSELKRSSGVAYSSSQKQFNIGNFLHASWQMGVVREVCWVIPGGSDSLTDIDKVRGWLRTVGFDAESAASFDLVDGQIRGLHVVARGAAEARRPLGRLQS